MRSPEGCAHGQGSDWLNLFWQWRISFDGVTEKSESCPSFWDSGSCPSIHTDFYMKGARVEQLGNTGGTTSITHWVILAEIYEFVQFCLIRIKFGVKCVWNSEKFKSVDSQKPDKKKLEKWLDGKISEWESLQIVGNDHHVKRVFEAFWIVMWSPESSCVDFAEMIHKNLRTEA